MSTLLLTLILAGASPQVEIATLDEANMRGELLSLSSDTAALRTKDGDVMIAVDQLLAVTPVQQPETSATTGDIYVKFTDGTFTPATSYSVKSGRATITLPGGEEISTSVRNIREVRILKQGEHEKSLWQDIVASNPKGDAVIVRKGGGDKPVSLDFLEGALRDVTSASVQFVFEGDVIPVNRNKVQVEGLLYYHADTLESKEAICRIDDNAGGRWMASNVRLEGDVLQWTTPGGIDRELSFASIQRLDFSLGKIAFLSDLEPVKKNWQPYLGSVSASDSARLLFEVRRDTNFAGEILKIGDDEFPKGLAIHSRTEVAYRLPGQFSRFLAVVAIDPSQKHPGHVRLQIHGDSELLFDEPIAGDAAPKALELDITGKGRLTILVDYGEGWDIGDQLLLGGARVIR